MSKLNPQFFGMVKGGKLTLEKPDDFQKYIAGLEDKEILLVVKKAEYTRSNPQNAWYWGVVIKMISDEMGILPDETHEFLKSLFLKVGVEINGKRWEITKSTASLSIGDFIDYTEKCRQWAADELNCFIPLPDNVDWDE